MNKNILKIVIFSILTLVFTLFLIGGYGDIEYYTFFFDWYGGINLFRLWLPSWTEVAELNEKIVIIISIVIVLGLGIGNSLFLRRNCEKRNKYISVVMLYIILLLFNTFLAYKRMEIHFVLNDIFCLPPYKEYSLNDAIHEMDFWIIIFSPTFYYTLWHISLINLLKNVNKLKTHK